LKNYIFVFIGSGIGGMFRYWGSLYVYKILPPAFPFGTLFVNFVGTLLLGIIIYFFDYQKIIAQEIRLLLTIGLCGGITTFSAFSYETFELLKQKDYLLAIANIGLNVLITLSALFIIYKLTPMTAE
jgi:fluoride exporter